MLERETDGLALGLQGHASEAGLFSPESPGNGFDRMLVQGTQIWRGSKEGGFFLMIGKKSPS